MRHTLAASMLISVLTFKAILKELVSLANGNRKPLHPKPQSTPKNINHPSMHGASPTVMSVMTAGTGTSLPQTTS